MENQIKSNRIHPLVAGAAVSVMLVSLVGVAAITGILPNSNSTTPVAVLASAAPGGATDPIAASAPGNNASAITTLKPTTETKEFSAANTSPAAKPAPAVRHHPKPVHASQPVQTQNTQQYDEPVQVARAPVCSNCGTIESIQAIQQQAQPGGIGIGAVAGAVLGGVLGNQVGGGNGRKLATVAGAVGGGFAGNEVEKRARTTTSYEIRVRMEDGSSRSFSDSGQSGWRSGDRVRVVNGSLTSQG